MQRKVQKWLNNNLCKYKSKRPVQIKFTFNYINSGHHLYTIDKFKKFNKKLCLFLF